MPTPGPEPSPDPKPHQVSARLIKGMPLYDGARQGLDVTLIDTPGDTATCCNLALTLTLALSVALALTSPEA